MLQSAKLKDTLFQKENRVQSNYLEALYQSEKKEKEINQLQHEKLVSVLMLKKRNTIIFALFISIVLLIGISILFYRNIHHKRVISDQHLELQKQKIKELEREKQLVATQSLLEGETTERARISKDLHDGLGGMLSVVKLKIANMKGNMIMSEEHVATFSGAIEMLDNSISELRRVAHNLMPESLMKYGLNPALTDFCNNIEIVKYHFFGTDRRLDDKLEVAIYRIVHELVNNAIKHAEASLINVQFILEANRVSIVVQDNGKGFDLKQVDDNDSSGLKNIRSRVTSFGGKLDLFSAPGNGTEVTVEFNC
jgi:signal transduction histidine kinase